MRVGAIVLAAGEGRRFGGPKQLAPLDGRPLLEHALGAVAAADELVVVLGARAGEVRRAVDLGRARVVVAEDWAEGNAASLRAGVAALGDVDAAVVVLGDQPRMTPEVVEAALALSGGGERAVRATYAGAPGHPVVLPRALLGAVAALEGQAGALELLRGATTFEAGALCDPTDVDTPEDLEAVRA